MTLRKGSEGNQDARAKSKSERWDFSTKSDDQTEDGDAKMKSDTSFVRELEPPSAWMSRFCAVSEIGVKRENT